MGFQMNDKLLGSLLCADSIFLGLDDELSRFRQKSIASDTSKFMNIPHMILGRLLTLLSLMVPILDLLLLIMLRDKYLC